MTMTTNERGEQIGNMLNGVIDDKVSDDMSKGDIIDDVASSAGISASTLGQILNGSIECPPIERLQGIADALGIPISRVVTAAESDGCSYDDDDDDDGRAIVKTITTGIMTRDARIVRNDDVASGRMLNIEFSTETPVARGFGLEVLDHDPSSVRLERLRNKAPLLINHDQDQRAGVIIDADIAGSRGTAKARFGTTKTAKTAQQEVRDETLSAVSVGYRVHEMVLDKRSNNTEDVYRVVDWEPLEISLVAVGADPNAGVRAATFETRVLEIPTMTDKAKEDPAKKAAGKDEKRAADGGAGGSGGDSTSTVLLESASAQATQLERARVAEIDSIANLFAHVDGISRLASRAKAEGWQLDKFRAEVEPKVADAVPKVNTSDPKSQLGMSGGDLKRYSLFRAINALCVQRWRDGDPRRVAPFEMECSDAMSEQLDREPRGILVPMDVMQHTSWSLGQEDRERAAMYGLTLMQRTPPMGVATTGTVAAALKGVDHLAGSFIEALRPETVFGLSGGTMLPGLVGDVSIPKQTGRSTFTWVAEDADGTDSETPIGAVTMSPKTVSGAVPITRKLLKQSAPSVEGLVRNDLVLGIAEAVDIGVLNGSGAAGQPTGIIGTTGVLTQTVAAPGVPTWPEIVAFETKTAAQNALRGSPVYVMTPSVRGAGKTTAKDAGSGLFVIENNTANGYPVLTTTQVPANTILFGNYAQALLGMWGTLDLTVDVATKAKSGGIVLRAFQDLDVAVRHAQAFCKNA